LAPFVYGRASVQVGQSSQVQNEEVNRVAGNGNDSSNGQRLLTPAEVAALFRVDPKTVTRWAKSGKLSSIRTLGGHRRYWEDEVRRLLEQSAAS
jgi:excisionase family DNA binding protein